MYVYAPSAPSTSVTRAPSSATRSIVIEGFATLVRTNDVDVHEPARSSGSTPTPVASVQAAIKIRATAEVVRCRSFIFLHPFRFMRIFLPICHFVSIAGVRRYQWQCPRLKDSQRHFHAPHGRKFADLRLTASDRGATGGAAETLFAVKRMLGEVQAPCREAPRGTYLPRVGLMAWMWV